MKNSNVVWALVAGLAVGYIVGNKLPMTGDGGSSSTARRRAPSKAARARFRKTGSPRRRSAPRSVRRPDRRAALQRAQGAELQAVRLRLPARHRSPSARRRTRAARARRRRSTTGDRARQAGKTLRRDLAAVKKPDAPARAAAAADQRAEGELAAWTPIKGPKYAKVTIVEFSDFQ